MSPVSALRAPTMVTARQLIRRDLTTFVDVWRRVAGSEVRVTSLALRIAAASSRTVGRDVQVVQGDAAPAFYTASLPTIVGSVLRLGDELWDDTVRYRIVSVDVYPHEVQVLMQQMQ